MEFKVIDLNHFEAKDIPYAQQSFDLWLRVYNEILTKNNEKLDAELFLRSRYLSVLIKDQIVRAFCLLNIQNVNWKENIKLNYFRYSTDSVKHLILSNGYKLMSLEWLTANPEFRGQFTRHQPNEVLMSLSLQWMKLNGFDGMMGYSRTDLKADKVGEKFGGRPIDTIIRHGIECKIMLALSKDVIVHPNQKTQMYIEEILRNYLQTNQPTERAA